MLYYLGKGTDFRKEQCKEYKTLEGAKKAWEKAFNAGDAEISVWDENGVLVLGMTDDVPDGALQTNLDGSVNVYDEDGNKVGTVDAATAAAVAGETSTEDADEPQSDEIIILQGKTKVTVICEGSINIRRSASWERGNICGRASKGQTYYAKEIHIIEGKKMVETIDGLYLSGESEHVKIERM